MATLYDTDDASLWAGEFCRIFNGKMVMTDEYNDAVDHGPVTPEVMTSWFAAAMSIAIAFHAARELEPPEDEPEAFDPPEDDIRDEDKEAFMEGFGEGRPQSE